MTHDHTTDQDVDLSRALSGDNQKSPMLRKCHKHRTEWSTKKGAGRCGPCYTEVRQSAKKIAKIFKKHESKN